MERMKQLQECRDDEEASQEEMATRFEREKTESMLVVTAEDEDAPSRDISRHFEDPSYGYKEFSRRGEQVPTLRVQVRLDGSRRWDRSPLSRSLTALFLTLLRTTAGRTTASPWSTDSTPMSDRCWTRSSSWLTTSPTTPWRRTKTWTPACCAEPSGTTSTACSASGQFPNSSQVTGSRVGCACCLTAPLPAFTRYDDYDYGEINQLLDRSFKIYIKTMVCSPEKTTRRMYESFWRQFQHSEKVRPPRLTSTTCLTALGV